MLSDFEDAALDLNAAALDSLGAVDVILQNPGALPVQFRGIRGAGQALDNQTPAAYERVWTTTVELQQTPILGGTVIVDGVEYAIHSIQPDADSVSNGLTIYLNRKRAL